MKTHNNTSLLPITLLVSCVLFLGACDNNEKEAQLKKYIQQVKMRPPQLMKNTPHFEPKTAHAFPKTKQRSPFVSTTHKAVQQHQNRPKQPLEAFPLSDLRMVGTLKKDHIFWAIIAAPNGTVYHAHQGTYLGQHNGKIMSIDAKKIRLKEMIGAGDGWQTRMTTLTLVQ